MGVTNHLLTGMILQVGPPNFNKNGNPSPFATAKGMLEQLQRDLEDRCIAKKFASNGVWKAAYRCIFAIPHHPLLADSSGSGNRWDIVAKQQASVLSWLFCSRCFKETTALWWIVRSWLSATSWYWIPRPRVQGLHEVSGFWLLLQL